MGQLAGFAPWIIFWVVASPSTWEYGAGGALIAALILAIPDIEGRSLKTLDITSILFFAVLTVLGLILDRSELDWLEDYAQVISSGLLALVVLGSLAFTPFTEQYAREQAPREVWDSPQFKQRNFSLTTVWGLAFAGIAVSGLIAQSMDEPSAWLEWIIPIVLIVGAFKYTARMAAEAQAAAGRA